MLLRYVENVPRLASSGPKDTLHLRAHCRGLLELVLQAGSGRLQ